MGDEIRRALIPVIISSLLSAGGAFMVAVQEVSANGEQGKRNASDIKDVQTIVSHIKDKQSEMSGKLDLLVERAKMEGK